MNMKGKLLTVLLLFGIVTGGFAEFKWGLILDFNPEIFRFSMPTGDAAVEKITVTLPGPPPQTYTYDDINKGTMDFFSSMSNGYGHGNNLGKFNEMKINLDWYKENVAAHLQIWGDSLIQAGNGRGFMQGTGRSPNISSFFNMSFYEWWVRARADNLTVYTGNTSDRGKTAGGRFADYYDFLPVAHNNFGLIIPRVVSYYDLNINTGSILNYNRYGRISDENGNDTNNFQRTRSNERRNSAISTENWYDYSRSDRPYWSLGYKFSPFTVQVAGDAGYNVLPIFQDDPGLDDNWGRWNASARFSGEKIADFFTFDVIYRIKGTDYFAETDPPTKQPEGRGQTLHTFGAYFWLPAVIPDLGISFGYSGMLRQFESEKKSAVGGKFVEAGHYGPFFNGIDLRAQYNGIDKMQITFINNFTFALTQGRDSTDTNKDHAYAYNVFGNRLANKTSENYIAFFSSLALMYNLTEKLNLNLQVANQFGVITDESDTAFPSLGLHGNVNKEKTFQNAFGATLYASFQFNQYLLLQSGLIVSKTGINWETVQSGVSKTGALGNVIIGMPIRFRIVM